MSLKKVHPTKDCSQHDYCPHLHYKKCMAERLRNISYTVYPEDKIDLTGNAHIKTVKNKRISNIQTLAYEKYVVGGIDSEE